MGPDDNDGIDESLFPNREDLAGAEEVWGSGNEEIDKAKPVGSFQVEITGATLERSASAQKLQIHYELTILTGGDHKGEVLHKYDGLDTPQRASISQQQLRRLGVDTKKVSVKTLPAALLDLQSKKAIITAKMNGEYHNIYFNKLVGDDMAAPRSGGSSGVVKPGGNRPSSPPSRQTAGTGSRTGGGFRK